MRFVSINGLKWAVDLTWYVPPLTPSGRIDIRTAQETIRGEGANYWTRRDHQAGYGTSDRELYKTRSLAGWIEVPYSSFIGIFPLKDDGGMTIWWLFARLGGNNIGAYGDTVYESAEEAERGKQELLDLYPDHTELEEVHVFKTPQESLAFLEPLCQVSFFSQLKSDSVLFPVDKMWTRRAEITRKVLVASLITGVVLGGGIFVHHVLSEMGLTETAQRNAAETAAKKRMYQQHPEMIFKEVWQDAPGPQKVAASCLNGMGNMPYTVSGWAFQKAVCTMTPDPKQPKFLLKRTYSQTPASSFERLPKNARVDNVKLLEITDTLSSQPLLKNELKYPELMEKERIRRAFLQISQQYHGVRTKVIFKPQEKKTLGDAGTFTCPWVVGVFEISGLNIPLVKDMSVILSRIPGIVLKVVNCASGHWQIKGEMYGKP